MPGGLRLLVLDFDYFFPHRPDWASFETPYHREEVWAERALSLLLRGLPLPQAEGWEGFWARVAFAPGAVLYYADSNALAFHPLVREGVEEVLLLDAHHDGGYRPLGPEPACDDWVYFYTQLGVRVQLLYPPWRRPEEEPPPLAPMLRGVDQGGFLGVFHRVFLCRSGAWVPPWAERGFFELLRTAPLPKVALEPVEPRALDLEALRRRVEEEALGLWIMERLHRGR